MCCGFPRRSHERCVLHRSFSLNKPSHSLPQNSFPNTLVFPKALPLLSLTENHNKIPQHSHGSILATGSHLYPPIFSSTAPPWPRPTRSLWRWTRRSLGAGIERVFGGYAMVPNLIDTQNGVIWEICRDFFSDVIVVWAFIYMLDHQEFFFFMKTRLSQFSKIPIFSCNWKSYPNV